MAHLNWPKLSFAPVNLWSLPAAWKTQADPIQLRASPARHGASSALDHPVSQRIRALTQFR